MLPIVAVFSNIAVCVAEHTDDGDGRSNTYFLVEMRRQLLGQKTLELLFVNDLLK
jgi:hypothetical protein